MSEINFQTIRLDDDGNYYLTEWKDTSTALLSHDLEDDLARGRAGFSHRWGGVISDELIELATGLDVGEETIHVPHPQAAYFSSDESASRLVTDLTAAPRAMVARQKIADLANELLWHTVRNLANDGEATAELCLDARADGDDVEVLRLLGALGLDWATLGNTPAYDPRV